MLSIVAHLTFLESSLVISLAPTHIVLALNHQKRSTFIILVPDFETTRQHKTYATDAVSWKHRNELEF